MKIIYKTVKSMNVRSRLLSQNRKQLGLMNMNMETVKLLEFTSRPSALCSVQNFNFLARLVSEI